VRLARTSIRHLGRESLNKVFCKCSIAYGNLALPFSLLPVTLGTPVSHFLPFQICFVHQAAFDETEHRASDACGEVARLVYIKVSWPNKRVDFRLAAAS